MCLQSWKEEFYPILASDVDEQDALQHSLQKWIGLRPENLEKHNVVLFDHTVRDKFQLGGCDFVMIAASSCALCVHYSVRSEECSKCPLINCGRQFRVFVLSDNDQPMLDLFESVIKKENNV